MSFLRAVADFLVLVLRTLLYGWILALWRLVLMLAGAVRRYCRRRHLPGRLGKAAQGPCVPISDPAYKRPDPLIYDQYYLMAQGLAVSWDNPDVELRRNGVAVSSEDIQPGTEYEIVARIWNGSTEAPIVGLPVEFSYLSFGVGTVSHAIGQAKVDLGVKGGPGCPAFASVAWRTPDAPGHYCVQAQFSWLDDFNPNNNLGQENLQVVAAHSPARATFELRNDTDRDAEFHFEVDAYEIPPPPPCEDSHPPPPEPRGRRLAPGTVLAIPPGHERGEHPLPEGWSVDLAPARPALGAGEARSIEATVVPPAGFGGRQAVNVHAFRGRELAGGVTLVVEAAP